MKIITLILPKANVNEPLAKDKLVADLSMPDSICRRNGQTFLGCFFRQFPSTDDVWSAEFLQQVIILLKIPSSAVSYVTMLMNLYSLVISAMSQ